MSMACPAPPGYRIEVVPVREPDECEAQWRQLEERSDASFFQGWTWLGCEAALRWTNPLLLRAEANGVLVGLALLNRRAGALHLHQSGAARLDAVYVERNGPLLAREAPKELGQYMLEVALREAGLGRLVLPGLPEGLLPGTGFALRRRTVPAPVLDLAKVRAAGGDLLATVSANTRQQIRRSARAYAARGVVRLEVAGSLEEAETWLSRLAALHTASWNRRGQPGVFGDPAFLCFHRTLIRRGFSRQEIEVLRLSAGAEEVGYLYNFRHKGRVFAYQSGFADAALAPAEKPGLLAHSLAIQGAAARGDCEYDFLAGDQRYKRNLGGVSRPLAWAEWIRFPSPLLWMALARRFFRRG